MDLGTHYFRSYVKGTENGSAGYMQSDEKKIVIDPQYVERKDVILHEMIHAHEMLLLEHQPSFIRDVLFYCLYKNLSEKMADLDARIHGHTNAVSQIGINRGGPHDLLIF